MKTLLLKLLQFFTKPLFGRGYTERYFPFLIPIYEYIYFLLQPNGTQIVNTPLNTKLTVLKKDAHVGMYLLGKGEFEPQTTKFLIQNLSPNSTFFDIGANFGYYTVVCGKKLSTGKLYAFEPNSKSFELLKINVKQNGLHNVYLENIALGNSLGEVSFNEDPIHSGRSKISKTGKYKIKLTTLDSYCETNGISNIDFIKLDVEGYELEVLKGAKNIIENSQNLKLILEFNTQTLKSSKLSRTEFFNQLKMLGLTPQKLIHEQKGELVDYSDTALDNVLRRSTYLNILFAK